MGDSAIGAVRRDAPLSQTVSGRHCHVPVTFDGFPLEWTVPSAGMLAIDSRPRWSVPVPNEDPPSGGPAPRARLDVPSTAAGSSSPCSASSSPLGAWRLRRRGRVERTDAGASASTSRSTATSSRDRRPGRTVAARTTTTGRPATRSTASRSSPASANVRRLPPRHRRRPGLCRTACAIGCPTNQSDDKARSVVVRAAPAATSTSTRPSARTTPTIRPTVEVTAVAGVKQRDGSIATEERADDTGSDRRRRPDHRRGATGAEELTLTVECEMRGRSGRS